MDSIQMNFKISNVEGMNETTLYYNIYKILTVKSLESATNYTNALNPLSRSN